MSDAVPPPLPVDVTSPSIAAPAALQFGHADFADAPAGVTCTMCQKAIPDQYFEANGAVVCDVCRAEIVSATSRGTPGSRFFRALGAGTLAGAAGSLVYFLIAKFTGYEFGLVAVLVGLAVGAAVKWGCYGRGGRLYQALAVGLTYLAIVSTYVPSIIEGFLAAQNQAVGSAAAQAPAEPVTLGMFLLAWALLLLLACAAPFLAGMQNLLGLLIIGFGLYEAWKINRRQVVTVTGPHTVGQAATAPAPL